MGITFRSFCVALSCALAAASLSAQATRTWISGVGDDANPCSRTAPCKTFAGAISKTAAGGEIDAMDPGGFGTLVITKAITLDGGGGQVASILGAATNGITVNAGPGDVVILRNLRMNGVGSGLKGIRFLAGRSLVIENCTIDGFTTHGVSIETTTPSWITITNTTITGSQTNPMYDGVYVSAASTMAKLVLDRVRVLNSPHVGAFFLGGHATVRDSILTGGACGLALYNGSAQVSGTTISDNGFGVKVYSGSVLLSNCTITGNTTGTSLIGGSLQSTGDNLIFGNSAGNGPLGGTVPLQ